MEAVGFRKVQEGNEWVMVMEQVAPDLPQVGAVGKRASIWLSWPHERCPLIQQIKSLLEDALRQTAVGHPAPRAGPGTALSSCIACIELALELTRWLWLCGPTCGSR